MYLEATAIFDYMTIYEPRMDGHSPLATKLARSIGCFTTDPRVVHEFFIAGLPVWFIRPIYNFIVENILSLEKIIEPHRRVVLADYNPKFSPIYEGSDTKKLDAIHHQSRGMLLYPDPFTPVPSATTLISRSE